MLAYVYWGVLILGVESENETILIQRSSGLCGYRPARERKKEDKQGLGPSVSLPKDCKLDSITSNI